MPATGCHAAPPRRDDEEPVPDPGTWRERITGRGDTGEIDKVYDPGKGFPMARRYAREAGYR